MSFHSHQSRKASKKSGSKLWAGSMGTILPIREESDLKPRTVLSESNPNARAEIQSVNCIMVMLLINTGKKKTPHEEKRNPRCSTDAYPRGNAREGSGCVFFGYPAKRIKPVKLTGVCLAFSEFSRKTRIDRARSTDTCQAGDTIVAPGDKRFVFKVSVPLYCAR